MRWVHVHRGTAVILATACVVVPFTMGWYAPLAAPLAPLAGMVLATLAVNFATIAVSLGRSLDGWSLTATIAAMIFFVLHVGMGLAEFALMAETLSVWTSSF